MHPLLGDEIYNSLRGGGYSDGNKIRGYNGGGINLVEANGNIKRARKISTFMPMRGRKDGNGPHGPGATLENLMNAYSVLPLIKLRLIESALARQQDQLEAEEQQRQFYNNLPQDDDQQRQQQSVDQSAHSIGEPTNFNRFFDMDETSQTGNSQSSQLIQNKLRRAFHPMRGKKSMMDEYSPVEVGQSDPLPTLVY